MAKLDKTIAGLANFIFGIGSTLLIAMVNLDISIGIIIFHIIQINISFSLSFTDINKLRAW